MAQEEYFTKCTACDNVLSAPNPRLDKEPYKILNHDPTVFGMSGITTKVQTKCAQCGEVVFIIFCYSG